MPSNRFTQTPQRLFHIRVSVSLDRRVRCRYRRRCLRRRRYRRRCRVFSRVSHYKDTNVLLSWREMTVTGAAMMQTMQPSFIGYPFQGKLFLIVASRTSSDRTQIHPSYSLVLMPHSWP